MPKWMDGIAGFAPGKSLAVDVAVGVAVGALNPKNIAVGLAAALSIASVELSTGQQLGCLAVYVFVVVLGVSTPLVVTLVLGDTAQEAGRFSR
ncbi:MAG TPA: GAP family protein [Acidimicrobiales bacterium]|nr:GAP family protein [Acidimicrobiales bacterium]